ncbi:FAD binding domain-containing protein [Albimonas pacifica]|uniref:Xanthine dehydrogenase YagS FAD-binding subunit n=1 Tax=Albimonas pacifica TaxID=1114924 RepID=A0A1I3NBV5_9RHOB|nr:FAD binding domain-containing protein [Albimonas pacifica]SFJ06821.1 xanthine dehydrogenase YagS FAD-binding subunit [Albimonas pacifica]
MPGGDEIQTVEGLGDPDDLDPMQAAFVAHDGRQCGDGTPGHLTDVHSTGLDAIEGMPDGGLRIGAMVRSADFAAHERAPRDCPAPTRALVAGASGQLRDKAASEGNLLQRTRCPCFFDANQPCNTRGPGSGCGLLEGASRQLGLVGVPQACIATHPSDMAVGPRAPGATVETVTAEGEARAIPLAEFLRLPDDTPEVETVPAPGEFVAAATPPAPAGGRQGCRKVRGRASCAFAVVSVALVRRTDGTG